MSRPFQRSAAWPCIASSGLCPRPTGMRSAAPTISIVDRDTVVRVARSDSAGRFMFEGLTTPGLTVRVRHARLRTASSFGVRDEERAYREYLRDSRAKRGGLDPSSSRTQANTLPPNPRLVAFNERRATNSFGHYVTEDILRETQAAIRERGVAHDVRCHAPSGQDR